MPSLYWCTFGTSFIVHSPSSFLSSSRRLDEDTIESSNMSRIRFYIRMRRHELSGGRRTLLGRWLTVYAVICVIVGILWFAFILVDSLNAIDWLLNVWSAVVIFTLNIAYLVLGRKVSLDMRKMQKPGNNRSMTFFKRVTETLSFLLSFIAVPSSH